jgi:hypothetical protein
LKQRLTGLDLGLYVTALGHLVRNPALLVAPLLMTVIGVLVQQLLGNSGGVLGGISGGFAGLFVFLLDSFGFGVAMIIADDIWRHGKGSFDHGWEEGKRRGGGILLAAVGYNFILFVAGYAGNLVGPLGLVVMAVAAYFFIYTIPAAAIGGIPGGAALQASLEKARANPVPTLVLAIVTILVYVYLGTMLVPPLLSAFFSPYNFTGSTIIDLLISAIIRAVAISYVALVTAKVYSELTFERRPN